MYRLLTTVVLLTFLAGSALAAGRVILVGSGTPDPRDEIVIEHLERLGFTVEPIAHDAGHPVDLSGVALVFISESTSSGNIAGAYADSTVPVVNSEAWTYDDMAFTPDDTGLNSDAGDSLTIVNPNHPITQGLKDWDMIDETYTINEPGEGCEILLTVDHPKSMRGVGWTRQYKNARVFCLASGHDNQTFANEHFRTVVARGIRWLANQI